MFRTFRQRERRIYRETLDRAMTATKATGMPFNYEDVAYSVAVMCLGKPGFEKMTVDDLLKPRFINIALDRRNARLVIWRAAAWSISLQMPILWKRVRR
jgi:hypothetical protein